MSEETKINPELLKSLGRVVQSTPPERPPHTDTANIVKPLNPPKVVTHQIDLTTPKSK